MKKRYCPICDKEMNNDVYCLSCKSWTTPYLAEHNFYLNERHEDFIKADEDCEYHHPSEREKPKDFKPKDLSESKQLQKAQEAQKVRLQAKDNRPKEFVQKSLASKEELEGAGKKKNRKSLLAIMISIGVVVVSCIIGILFEVLGAFVEEGDFFPAEPDYPPAMVNQITYLSDEEVAQIRDEGGCCTLKIHMDVKREELLEYARNCFDDWGLYGYQESDHYSNYHQSMYDLIVLDHDRTIYFYNESTDMYISITINSDSASEQIHSIDCYTTNYQYAREFIEGFIELEYPDITKEEMAQVDKFITKKGDFDFLKVREFEIEGYNNEGDCAFTICKARPE